MSIAIIINPISGGARPGEARARAQLALAVVDAHGDRGGGAPHRARRARARAGEVGRAARRAARAGVGRRRHGQRSGVRARVRRGAARHRAGRIGQRPGARARRQPAARSAPSPTRCGGAARRSTSASSTAACSSTSPASASTRTSPSQFADRPTRRGFAGYAGITARALTGYAPQPYRITTGGVADRRTARSS